MTTVVATKTRGDGVGEGIRTLDLQGHILAP